MKKTVFSILIPVLLILLATPTLAKSPTDIAKGFIKAATSANFKKLAEFSCKNSGPYLTEDMAAKIDTSDLGFIQEIVREEKGQFDVGGLRLVVARLSVLGALEFGFFPVFETPKGWKIYVSNGPIREYPLKNNEQKADLLCSLASFCSSNGLYSNRGIKASLKAYQLVPDSRKCTETLAWSYFKGKKYEAAYYTMHKFLNTIKNRYMIPTLQNEDPWKQIISKLPKDNFSIQIVAPRSEKATKQDCVKLEVKLSPKIFLSINKSPYKFVKNDIFKTKRYLEPGDNQIAVTAKKYWYGGQTKTQTVKVQWNKYKDNGDGTITDLTTGLIWTKNGQRRFWRQAGELCKKLRLGGYSDWRLPTREELNKITRNGSIIDRKHQPYFSFPKHAKIWTGESINDRYAWVCIPKKGFEKHNKRFFSTVIAVTSGGLGKGTGKDDFRKGTPNGRISPKEATKKQDERPVSREVSIKSEREEKTEPRQTDVKRPTTSRIDERPVSREASIKSEKEEKTAPGQTDVKRPTTSRIFEKIKSDKAIKGLVKGLKGIFEKLPPPKQGDLPKTEEGEL